MGEKRNGSGFESAVGRAYWSVWARFGSTEEERVKFAILASGAGTGILALTAATTAMLISLGNWPTALLLSIAGIGAVVFTWFAGLHRFEEWIVGDA